MIRPTCPPKMQTRSHSESGPPDHTESKRPQPESGSQTGLFDLLEALSLADFLSTPEMAAWLGSSETSAALMCRAADEQGFIRPHGLWAWETTDAGLEFLFALSTPSSAADLSPPAAAPELESAPLDLDGPDDLRTTLAVWMERAGLDDTTKAHLWADLEGAPT